MSDVFKKRIYPVIFIVIITIIFITPISILNVYTKDIVKQNETIVLKKSVLSAAGVPLPLNNQDINTYFSDYVTTVGKDKHEYFEVRDKSGNLISYVFPVDGPGLWGQIKATLGFDSSLATFTGIDFVSQNETPGLGARITEKWFRVQFRGKKGPITMVPEGTAKANNEIDAITGASLTSGFIQKLVNTTDPKKLMAQAK